MYEKWSGRTRWRSVAPEVAVAHPLYGLKNWLVVFALAVLATPLIDVGTIYSLAQSTGATVWELIANDRPWVSFTRAGLGWETLCASAILWMMLTKSPYFRVGASDAPPHLVGVGRQHT